MGWSIDNICWNVLRKKMKGRFAGTMYSMATSYSPVVIKHRGKLSGKEMTKYAKLFPKNIRVEFQETTDEGESYKLYGKGDFIMYGSTYGRFAIPVVNVEDEIRLQEEYDMKHKDNK